ncbi:hypothetical protein CRG98_005930 [Punica granatum]|uniref:Uncharacterized protein n=1 Tax=Punica granatum TaxID=22663 RepID=A0A2I0KYZ3_PUNGR|nr:hypothetical protein CRG98_005930 [Punica granatum]
MDKMVPEICTSGQVHPGNLICGQIDPDVANVWTIWSFRPKIGEVPDRLPLTAEFAVPCYQPPTPFPCEFLPALVAPDWSFSSLPSSPKCDQTLFFKFWTKSEIRSSFLLQLIVSSVSSRSCAMRSVRFVFGNVELISAHLELEILRKECFCIVSSVQFVFGTVGAHLSSSRAGDPAQGVLLHCKLSSVRVWHRWSSFELISSWRSCARSASAFSILSVIFVGSVEFIVAPSERTVALLELIVDFISEKGNNPERIRESQRVRLLICIARDFQEDHFQHEDTEHVDSEVYWDSEYIFNEDAEGHLDEEEEHIGDGSDPENGEHIVVRLSPTTADMVISSDEDEGYISEELVDKCISDDEKSEEEFRKYPEFDEKATFGEGLKLALEELSPGTTQRNCVLYIWRNFYSKYKNMELTKQLWKCARSTTVVEFDQNMMIMKRMNEDAWAWLKRFKLEKYVHSWYSTER